MLGIGLLLSRVDWVFATAPLIVGVLLGAFGLLGILNGLVLANQEIRGHKFLVERGVAAKASVVEVSYDEDQCKILHYEFTDDKGRVRKGSCRATSLRGDSLRSCVEGHELDVLYAPRNPRHHVVYALAFYHVAPM